MMAEVRALLRLGGPMIATQFFIMGMGFVDTLMAGRYGTLDLAGVALGGNVMWPLFILASGLTMALIPIIAQLRGARRVAEAGAQVRQGLWIALGASVLTTIAMNNAALLFSLVGVDPAAADVAQRYLAAVSWGIPAGLVYLTLRYTSEGLGRTLPPMLIAGAALALNALLNWVFIYGKFGVPAFGGEGCGWATSVVMWFQVLLIAPLVRLPVFRATGLIERFDWPQLKPIAALLKVGAPIGLTIFLEMAFFSVVGFLIASLGVIPLAAHSVAGNINWATYVFPMAVGSAASIRVGYFVGSRDYARARQVVRVAMTLSLTYAVVVSGLLVLARHQLVAIYSEDPAVLAIAATLLLFIAVYQLLDDAQATMAGALRGYTDTRMPMVYSLIGFWLLALPFGALCAFGAGPLEPLGVYGFWMGLTLGLAAVATLLALRLRRTSRDVLRIEALAV